MRKLFYAVVALSLFATSCAKDEAAAPEATAKTKTVTFSVKAPEMKTRATTFTAGNGAQANKLYYAFYDESGLVTGISQTGGVAFDGDEEISVSFVEGKAYTGIFWAQNDASGYTVSFATALADAKVAMNYGTEVANSENYDGFWAGVNNIQDTTADILLWRPFAQLNIGVTTADIAKAVAAGVDVASVKTVVTDVPTTLNLADCSFGDVKAEVTFDWVAKGAATIDLGEDPNEKEYTIYSTNYVLVGYNKVGDSSPEEKSLTTVTFKISEEAANAAESAGNNLTREYSAVPVQANYRTFIVGDILTGDSSADTHTWTVKIAPGFYGDKQVEGNN